MHGFFHICQTETVWSVWIHIQIKTSMKVYIIVIQRMLPIYIYSNNNNISYFKPCSILQLLINQLVTSGVLNPWSLVSWIDPSKALAWWLRTGNCQLEVEPTLGTNASAQLWSHHGKVTRPSRIKGTQNLLFLHDWRITWQCVNALRCMGSDGKTKKSSLSCHFHIFPSSKYQPLNKDRICWYSLICRLSAVIILHLSVSIRQSFNLVQSCWGAQRSHLFHTKSTQTRCQKPGAAVIADPLGLKMPFSAASDFWG